ncbi:hypothetical protein RJ639_018636 [Escallonia herrerae]|uniref:Uncharacterized protein n=1 Tax=Escallonia herrerae TaxID=1293975 RepID=A0AA89AIF8_9ASTE|nr:hypothetical protein RJ639_018636 [Escallonia herrerae]
MDISRKTQEAFVDTGATHNFMSPRVAEWLGLNRIKDGSYFTAVNAKERLTKRAVKNVDLRIGRWTGKADFNIIDMDELGVVLAMDFIEKSSTTLNPYCEVMEVIIVAKAFRFTVTVWRRSFNRQLKMSLTVNQVLTHQFLILASKIYFFVLMVGCLLLFFSFLFLFSLSVIVLVIVLFFLFFFVAFEVYLLQFFD